MIYSSHSLRRKNITGPEDRLPLPPLESHQSLHSFWATYGITRCLASPPAFKTVVVDGSHGSVVRGLSGGREILGSGHASPFTG